MLESAGPLTPEEEHALARTAELLLVVPKGAMANWWESARATAVPAGARLAESASKVVDQVQARMPSGDELRAAASTAGGTIQQGFKQAVGATQAALPTTGQIKESARSVLSASSAGLPV